MNMPIAVGHARPDHLAARPGDMTTCEGCGQAVWMADEERIWRPTSRVCPDGANGHLVPSYPARYFGQVGLCYHCGGYHWRADLALSWVAMGSKCDGDNMEYYVAVKGPAQTKEDAARALVSAPKDTRRSVLAIDLSSQSEPVSKEFLREALRICFVEKRLCGVNLIHAADADAFYALARECGYTAFVSVRKK